MKSNQRQMICNLLGRQCGGVTLDKVTMVQPDGGIRVIDEPVAVLGEVQNHFRQWTAKWQVQPLTGWWADMYQPVSSINPSWYSGLMDPPSASEVQQAIVRGLQGKLVGLHI